MTDTITITPHLHAARVLVAQLSISITAMDAALTSALGEAAGDPDALHVAGGMFADAQDYLTDMLDTLERAARLAIAHTAKS